jgi:hypothetical protein
MGPVCKGSYRYVKCSSGEEVEVVSGFYGRVGYSHCNYRGSKLRLVNCSFPRAKSVLSLACDGRKGCWIFVDMFGSSSNNAAGCDASVENKYVFVEWRCRRKRAAAGDAGM